MQTITPQIYYNLKLLEIHYIDSVKVNISASTILLGFCACSKRQNISGTNYVLQ